MCGNPFKRVKTPEVQQVAPAPTPVTTQDVDTLTDEAEKQKKRKGYQATRIADDRNVLTDAGKKTTLG